LRINPFKLYPYEKVCVSGLWSLGFELLGCEEFLEPTDYLKYNPGQGLINLSYTRTITSHAETGIAEELKTDLMLNREVPVTDVENINLVIFEDGSYEQLIEIKSSKADFVYEGGLDNAPTVTFYHYTNGSINCYDQNKNLINSFESIPHDFSKLIIKANEGVLTKSLFFNPVIDYQNNLLQNNDSDADNPNSKNARLTSFQNSAATNTSDIEVIRNPFINPESGEQLWIEYAVSKSSGEVHATAILDQTEKVLSKTFIKNKEDGTPYRKLSYSQDFIDSVRITYIDFEEISNFQLTVNQENE
jgi:hypothetical protein